MKYFRRLAKDSAIYGGGDLIGRVIAFFTFPILAAALSPFAFGALELITTSASLTAIFIGCGLNNAVSRFYWDAQSTEAQRPVITSSGFAAMFLFGVAAALIAIAVMPLLLDEIRVAALPVGQSGVFAALVLMICTQWLQYAMGILRLHFAPWKYMTLVLCNRVLGALLGVVVVVVFHKGLDGLLVVQATVAVAVLPLALWLVRKDLTWNVDGKWIRQLVHFGYPFIFVELAYWLFGSMDRWMLASISSVEEVGIYSVAYRFATIAMFVSQAFGQAWSPISMKLLTDQPHNYRIIYGQVLLLLLNTMKVVGGGIALFAGEIIAVVMPGAYVGSGLPLAIYCFGIVVLSTQQVTAIGISLEKKTAIFAQTTWITAAFNFVLNWLLIPKYGAAGAAAATAVSYLLLTSIYLFHTQKLHPIVIQWSKLFLILALGAVIAVLAIALNSTEISPNLILLKATIALICAGIGWLSLPIASFRPLR